MTTKELYKKHKSGSMSNQKFLYEVRRDAHLPWINNLTSYEDAVKILKNKGIINEADGKKYGEVEIISKTIDMVNPYEYSKGMDYELGMATNPVRTDLTEEEVLLAQKKVLKNITKDANYYTRLYAGQKIDDTESYKEIEIEGKKLEPNLKAEMKGRKADGYLKKEAIKSPKSNVKVDLGKKEAGTKKPKGVSEFKAKGVTGSFKTIKEGIEEILREKLAKKKANEAKVNEISFDDAIVPIKQTMASLGYKGEYDPFVEEGYIFEKDFADGLMRISITNLYDDQEKFTFTAQHFDRITKSQLFGLIKKKVIDYENGNWVSKDGDVEIVDLGTGMFSLDKPGVEDLIKKAVQRVEDKAVATKGIPENKTKVDEHHNDPDFPVVNGLYDLLDAIVADWGKEDLYQEVEDIIVAYTEPDATMISKEAIKKIKDVLENYDVLEDYAELISKIAVKEPGISPRYNNNNLAPIDRMYNSDDYVQAQRDMNENSPKTNAVNKIKETLKASLKKEALLVPKNTPPDQIKKYSVQGIDVKLDTK